MLLPPAELSGGVKRGQLGPASPILHPMCESMALDHDVKSTVVDQRPELAQQDNQELINGLYFLPSPKFIIYTHQSL